MEWMILPFKRYFDFKGRSRRMEYWMFALLNMIVSVVLMAIFFAGFPWAEMMEQAGNPQPAGQPAPMPEFSTSDWVLLGIGGTLITVWSLGVFIPSIAVTVRRLHDLGYSGWWYGGLIIAGLIPLVNILAMIGWIVFLVFMFLDGNKGPNQYGPDPKDPGQSSVFE